MFLVGVGFIAFSSVIIRFQSLDGRGRKSYSDQPIPRSHPIKMMTIRAGVCEPFLAVRKGCSPPLGKRVETAETFRELLERKSNNHQRVLNMKVQNTKLFRVHPEGDLDN